MTMSFSSSVMLGNTCDQMLVTTSYNSPLTPNGPSWAPAQAKSEGRKARFQDLMWLPPRGKGKSETLYRGLRAWGTRIRFGMRTISLPMSKLPHWHCASRCRCTTTCISWVVESNWQEPDPHLMSLESVVTQKEERWPTCPVLLATEAASR